MVSLILEAEAGKSVSFECPGSLTALEPSVIDLFLTLVTYVNIYR